MHRPSSASRVYWAMTHVMARRLTGAPHLARSTGGEYMNVLLPKNIEGTRAKLKRLVKLGILSAVRLACRRLDE
ncbi:hypothetical protein [Streptomyces sp. NPDC005969]|uniref:hypothetical protein n=1 Tax=Streptomyces sp. NPDC005969 TaxID=3156722 RepID=UPI003411279E